MAYEEENKRKRRDTKILRKLSIVDETLSSFLVSGFYVKWKNLEYGGY